MAAISTTAAAADVPHASPSTAPSLLFAFPLCHALPTFPPPQLALPPPAVTIPPIPTPPSPLPALSSTPPHALLSSSPGGSQFSVDPLKSVVLLFPRFIGFLLAGFFFFLYKSKSCTQGHPL